MKYKCIRTLLQLPIKRLSPLKDFKVSLLAMAASFDRLFTFFFVGGGGGREIRHLTNLMSYSLVNFHFVQENAIS